MDWREEKTEFFWWMQREAGIDLDLWHKRWQANNGNFQTVPAESIIRIVIKELDVKYNLVMNSSFRERKFSDARKIICHHLNASLGTTIIGDRMGMDHSSVIAACKKYNELYKSNILFKEKSDKIISALTKLKN